ncbi:MAG: hypothetical protein LBU18_05585 [Treponema sp.]|jgi:hypothetical protein|nr:hypothetical protein [Treponema sp.]
MKTITCDVCKHAVEQPIPARNYFHLAHRDICEACHDELEAAIKPVVRTKQPFDYGWYNKLVQESIEKAIQKGKW